MTDSMYEDGAINSRLENVTALYDEDGSVKFVNDSLSSSNFDGSIFSITASVGVSQVSAGQLISIESSSAISFYPIIKVEEEDPVLSSPYTGAHYIYYFDGNEITTASYSSSAASVVVKYDDWDNKDLGTAGWTITSNGNAIFSNIAARGRIEATSGYIGDAYSGWEIGANLLSNASVGFYAPSAFSSTEIAIFSGSPFTGRATAPFRVNYGGQMNATGASISGALTATTLNVGGSAGITYDGSVVTIGSSVIINSGLTANSLQVGASPTLLRIANDVQGTNDGIYIDPYNFWYSDGKFSVGGSANSACWNGNALSVKGNVIATSGSFSGDITAAAGRFTGSVTVSSGGKFIAGTVDNGVVLDDSGLTGFSNGSTMFRIPTTGSPTLAGFTIINSGLTGSSQNANIIVGNTGSAANSITIRGDKTGGQNAAIFTVQSGVATSSATGNGFYVDDAGRMRLAGSNGALTFDGNNLSITGNVNATSGSFTGAVTASSGTIGGWKIENNALSSSAGYGSVQISSSPAGISVIGPFGGGGVFISASSPTFAMWAGSPDPTNAKFSIDYTGILKAVSASFTSAVISGSISAQTITASNGNISGFNISNTSLTKVNGLNWVGVTSGASAFFAGATSASGAEAKFWVSDTGSIFASNATITGNITATNITASVGNIAGFTLAKNQLSATNIIISSSGGFRLGNNNQFSVTTNGILSASSASIVGDSIINGTNIGNGGGNIVSNLRIGSNALVDNTTGQQNTAIGDSALTNNTIGSNNVIIGNSAANLMTVGNGNIAIGRSALGNIDSANSWESSYNIAIGDVAGGSTVSGSGNVFINYSSGNTSDFNTFYLGVGGNNATGLGIKIDSSLNTFLYGNLSVDTNVLFVSAGNNRVGINEVSPASALHVVGAALISSNLNVDSGTLFVDATNNEVGIGTVSPASALHVVGGAYTTGNIEATIIHANSNGAGTNFRVGDDAWIGDINVADTISIKGISGAATNGFIRFGSDSNSFGYNGTLLSYNGSIRFGSAASVVSSLYVGTTSSFVGNSNFGGNVTLGTSSAATEVRSQAIFDTLTANVATVQIAGAANNYRLQRSTASSRKWKHDIKDMPSVLHNVLNLRPVTFKYNLDYLPSTDNRSGLDVYGLIAEEVADIIPLAADYDEGQPSDWNYRILVPILIKAIQEQQKEIQELSDKIDALGDNNG